MDYGRIVRATRSGRSTGKMPVRRVGRMPMPRSRGGHAHLQEEADALALGAAGHAHPADQDRFAHRDPHR